MLTAEAADVHGDEGETPQGIELASVAPTLNSSVCSRAPLPELEAASGPVDRVRPPEPATSCDPNPKPGVVAFRDFILNHFGCGKNNGITRACDGGAGAERSAHEEGRAWDWGVSASSATRAAAEEVLAWLLASDANGKPHANARRWGLTTVLYDGRVWSASIDGPCTEGWSRSCTRYCQACADMVAAGRSGDLMHRNHVHFSFSRDGAAMLTSAFTGGAAVEQPTTVAAGASETSTSGTETAGERDGTSSLATLYAAGERVVEPAVVAAQRAADRAAEAAEVAWSAVVAETKSTWRAGSVAVSDRLGRWYDSAAGLWRDTTAPAPVTVPGWRPSGGEYNAGADYNAGANYYAGTGYNAGANYYGGTGYAAAGGLAACWNAGGACELENAPDGLGDCRLGIVVCSGGAPVCTRRAGCTGLLAAGGIDQGLGTTAATTASCTPAAEQCNGRDDDCDGQIDEASGLKQVEGLPCPSSGVGTCQAGTTICAGGEVQCQPRAPETEQCDGLDNDCNGTIDDGAGGCAATAQGAARPAPELCNGKDEDLDGFPDNGNPGGGAPCTLTEAGGGQGTGQGTVMCARGELQCLALSFAPVASTAPTKGASGDATQSGDPSLVGCALVAPDGDAGGESGGWLSALFALVFWRRRQRRARQV